MQTIQFYLSLLYEQLQSFFKSISKTVSKLLFASLINSFVSLRLSPLLSCCLKSLVWNMDYESYKIFDPEVEKIIQGLRIADCMHLQDIDTEYSKFEETLPYNLKELSISDVLTCSYCNVSFADAFHQRSHFKLDWHRYNLKRALSGNKSVSEEVFNTLADDISSLSGSDNEKSENSDTETSEAPISLSSENFPTKYKSIRHAKAFFENNENKILSVYKCLLYSKKENLDKDELIRRVHELVKQPKKWIIILIGGGHFASAIFNNGEILHHKTFHCYTVRAKQGGSQSMRDNKSGSHLKSAGASLRRYNEQALVQHVHEIIASWSEYIKQCSLILYRATGPYNRGVLFGGKNPPLSKTDLRLRSIPFPTRRATFKETKKVFDMFSSIEIYGTADNYKNRFPSGPDKRTWSPRSKKESSNNSDDDRKQEQQCKAMKLKSERCHNKDMAMVEEEISDLNNQSASSQTDDEDENEFELVSSDITVCLQDLQEYDDTVPQFIKDLKKSNLKKKKKRKKLSSKQKEKLERKKWTVEFKNIQGNLIKSCENEDKDLLLKNLSIYDELPEKKSTDSIDSQKLCAVFTKEDFIHCLNSPINEENKNTLLHLAAGKGLHDFITLLLTAGADPAIKNKTRLTPYVIADKETRNSFRAFAASFPHKYDFKKANIPEALSEELAKELDEKKKEKKKLKRMKEKIKKQEDKEKKNEEEEKKKFLALSDREKCALAAERRIIATSTSNLKSAKPPVLSRCFQCGVDITGIVAFEYGYNRFCSISCLKAHRLKTNSYGKEI